MVPPPTTLAARVTGNAVVAENSRSSIVTCSSTRGFQWPRVRPNLNRPLVIFTSFTDRSSGAVPAGGAACGDLLVLPPKLEKFHSPEGDCTSAISGWSTVRYVTTSFRDIRNGQI